MRPLTPVWLALNSRLHIDKQWCSKHFPDSSRAHCNAIPRGKVANMCLYDDQLCEGGTHRRCNMPQLPEFCDETAHCPDDKKGQWLQWSTMVEKEFHNKVKIATITVAELTQLKPSQTQLHACSVCGISDRGRSVLDLSTKTGCKEGAEFCPWSDGISVTTNDFNLFPAGNPRILDGHHRWASTRIVLEELEKEDPEKAKEFAQKKVDVVVYDFDWRKLDQLDDDATHGLVKFTKCGLYLHHKGGTESKDSASGATLLVAFLTLIDGIWT